MTELPTPYPPDNRHDPLDGVHHIQLAQHWLGITDAPNPTPTPTQVKYANHHLQQAQEHARRSSGMVEQLTTGLHNLSQRLQNSPQLSTDEIQHHIWAILAGSDLKDAT